MSEPLGIESLCTPTGWVNSSTKRFLDVIMAAVLLMITFPVLALAAIGVRVTSRGPILFKHERAGRNGRPVTILKLRTMRQSNSLNRQDESFEDDSERLTPYGRFLRRFSIDELPQFFNVLRGDMSIIGPRPLPMIYVERYSESQRCRLVARPGLTGLSQVEVRNSGSWDEKLSLDAQYVSQASPALDVRIFFRTIRTILTGSGVSAPGHATMPEFKKEPTERDR